MSHSHILVKMHADQKHVVEPACQVKMQMLASHLEQTLVCEASSGGLAGDPLDVG